MGAPQGPNSCLQTGSRFLSPLLSPHRLLTEARWLQWAGSRSKRRTGPSYPAHWRLAVRLMAPRTGCIGDVFELAASVFVFCFFCYPRNVIFPKDEWGDSERHTGRVPASARQVAAVGLPPSPAAPSLLRRLTGRQQSAVRNTDLQPARACPPPGQPRRGDPHSAQRAHTHSWKALCTPPFPVPGAALDCGYKDNVSVTLLGTLR